jgi:hypothetical protein
VCVCGCVVECVAGYVDHWVHVCACVHVVGTAE